ncbi:MAG: Gmad2 immunoglobulin-like domain-containing protein [bacterium]|nr:Gmad2 immunoglobulin-like domain-containing protein [bacterium]
MQRNIVLVGAAIFILLFVGVVLYGRKIPVQSTVTPATQSSSSASSGTAPTTVSADTNITVTSPTSGETVQFPIIITGEARVFESQLNYRIKDEKGMILSQGSTTANAPDAGQFGPYTITIQSLGEFTSGKLTIEVFDFSAKDGSEIDKVTVPVMLQ